jgi:hypothetical protein
MTGRQRRAILIAAVAAGAVAGLLFLLADPTPLLDPAALAAARERWKARGLADYDLTVRVETDTRAAERLVTEVRGGKATRLLRNGQPVDLRDAYSVDGLFAIIDREVEMAAAGTRGEAEQAPGAPRRAKLKAAFDPALGIPLIFKRLAPNRLSLVIRVERLTTPAGEILHAGP